MEHAQNSSLMYITSLPSLPIFHIHKSTRQIIPGLEEFSSILRRSPHIKHIYTIGNSTWIRTKWLLKNIYGIFFQKLGYFVVVCICSISGGYPGNHHLLRPSGYPVRPNIQISEAQSQSVWCHHPLKWFAMHLWHCPDDAQKVQAMVVEERAANNQTAKQQPDKRQTTNHHHRRRRRHHHHHHHNNNNNNNQTSTCEGLCSPSTKRQRHLTNPELVWGMNQAKTYEAPSKYIIIV